MVAGKVNNWAFDTVPQKGLNGRIGYQPRGKGLGGSSAINAMVYIRGHRWDYDHWASLGNTGWSYADVLPYFKRSENNADFDGEYHGKGGPLHVNKLRTGQSGAATFSCRPRSEAQFRIREDFNAEDHEGLGIYQVTQENGERWSAARAYVHPHIGKPQQSAGRDVGAGDEDPVRGQARRRRRIHAGQGEEDDPRAARGDPGLRRVPVAAAADAVGRRRQRGARRSTASRACIICPASAQNLQDHPDFVFGYASDDPYFFGTSLKGIAAADPRHRAISPRAARADHHEFRRMRRLPEDAARSRQCPTSSCISAWRWSTITAASAIAAPASPAMSACCGRRAAARVALDQRRSARRAPDRSELPRRGRRSRGDGRGLQDHAAADGDAGAARAAEARTCSPRT